MDKKVKLQVGICSISFFMNIGVVISLILSGIASSFPEASVTQIQFVYTASYIGQIVAVIACAVMAKVITKKIILIGTCILSAFGGIVGFVFSANLTMLYVSSFIIGFSVGALAVVKSIIGEEFGGTRRASMFGKQSVSVSLGGTVFAVLCGYLAVSNWANVLLIFVAFIPLAVISYFTLPKGNVEKKDEFQKETGGESRLFSPAFVRLLITTLLYGVIYLTYSANITFMIDSVLAGYATSVVTIAMLVISIFSAKLFGRFKNYTPAIGLGLLAIGLWLPAINASFPMIILSSAVFGGGVAAFAMSTSTMIADYVSGDNLTLANQMYSGALMIGMALNTIVITVPATWINDSVNTRFIFAAMITTIICIINIVLEKKEVIQEVKAE